MRIKSSWLAWDFSSPSAKGCERNFVLSLVQKKLMKCCRGFHATTSLKTCSQPRTTEKEEEPRHSEISLELMVFSLLWTPSFTPLCYKIPLLQQQQAEHQLNLWIPSQMAQMNGFSKAKCTELMIHSFEQFGGGSSSNLSLLLRRSGVAVSIGLL